MKRLYLIITLICPAAFAQEQDEIGIGGSPMVGGVVLGNSDSSEAINIAAIIYVFQELIATSIE